MRRILLPVTALLLASSGAAQAQTADTTQAQAADAVDHDALIRSALSAAPAAVAENATVVDLEQNVLREGTNEYVCMPDNPDVPNNAPMCLDGAWREMFDAYMNKRPPEFEGIGIGYMLQGDFPVSNVDPFATGPTVDNEWLAGGVPHIMMVVSDHRMLEGLPTDPDNGGPWVMWRGTPYAHIMIPTVPR